MKEIRNILEAYKKLDLSSVNVALATVLKVRGSSYRSPGARMLITDVGQWVGSISGGCLEGDALRKARKVIAEGIPALVTYDTREDHSGMALGLGCNGIIDVLLEPIKKDQKVNPISLLEDFKSTKQPGAHALIYNSEGIEGVFAGQHIVFSENGHSATTEIPQETYIQIVNRLDSHLKSGKSRTERILLENGFADVFLEIIEPPVRLLIFGGGFDVKPVTEFGASLGWDIVVTEECIAHTVPANFPEAESVAYCQTDQILSKFEITDYTAAVVMSHNYKYDKNVLGQLLTRDIRYIGVLGPRTRFEKIVNELTTEGNKLSGARINAVHSPIGLDIGAETPDEIAVSIISEIKATFSGRSGESLKNRDEPIHLRNEGTEEVYKQHLLQ